MSIYGKLSKIQVGLKAPKSQYNKFGGYHYRSCEDILEALKPYLKEYSLTLLIHDSVVQIGERYYIKAVAVLTDGENSVTTHAFAREAESKKGMDESQITGAASSYARKYALNGLFCIDDQKDADSTNKHGKEEAPQDAGSKAKALLERMEKLENIFALRNWWEKHSKEITSLPEEYRTELRRMKDTLKKKYEEESKDEKV